MPILVAIISETVMGGFGEEPRVRNSENCREVCMTHHSTCNAIDVYLVAELPSSIASPGASNDDDIEAAPTYSNGYQLLSTDPNVCGLLSPGPSAL